jgi:AcrR family transcriptional regulator
VSKSGFCEEPATKEKLLADKPESNEEKAPEAPAPKQAKRSPEGNNRNSLRSLHLLEQSYLNLIMRKPVDKITVADITREAGLNRGTFYVHFSSISELESYALQHLVDRFMSIGSSWFDISFVENPRPMLDQIGAFMEQHRTLITTIRKNSSSNPFMEALEKSLRIRIHDDIVEGFEGDKEAADIALITTDYIVHGILNVYSNWLSGYYETKSLEEVNRSLEPLIKGTGTMLVATACYQNERQKRTASRGE